MDEKPNSKFTFAPVGKRVFVWTISMKIYATCTVIRMRIKWFSCETFCTRTCSANRSSDGGSQVCIMSQAVHQASTHSSFCSRKWLGVFLLSLPWMGCQSITGLPPNINFDSTYLYTWGDTEALWEQSVSPKNTIQCSQPGLEPRLLEIQ